MPQWKEIVGLPFTPDEFIDYVNSLAFLQWRPAFCVLHNTEKPTLEQWHRAGGSQYIESLVHWYRDTLGWSGGPHLFVDDRLIWTFTPLWLPGVHTPSWNHNAWGIEWVGDYERESLSEGVFNTGCSALATLHEALGLDPATLRLHKEDPATTHTGCPGRHVIKADVIATINDKLAKRRGGEHLPERVSFAGVIGGSSSTNSTDS